MPLRFAPRSASAWRQSSPHPDDQSRLHYTDRSLERVARQTGTLGAIIATPFLMRRSISSGLLAGALAGIAGALAMNQLQRLAAYARGGREAPDATVGIPRTGRGPQPAQAIGNASNDATVRIANAIASTAGYTLTDPRAKKIAGEFVHLAFGALNGALYSAAVEVNPRWRAAAGVPFGLAVWAVADEGIVPALGLSRSPRECSTGLHAYSFTSHVVYGATTEFVRGLLRGQ
jgi:putative membrane protein